MSAKKISKTEKREKILLSAMKIFARKGINNSTVKDIAIEAGIGKGTIYEYFKDKNEIIASSFHFFMGMFESGIEEIVLLESDAKVKLLNIIEYLMKFLREEQDELLNLIFDFWAESIRTKSVKDIIYREMRNFYRAYREMISDIISKGKEDGSFSPDVDVTSFSSILLAMLDGIMVQWIIDKEQLELNSIEKEYKRIINSINISEV